MSENPEQEVVDQVQSEEIQQKQETVDINENVPATPENKIATKADVNACTEAIRELTKVVAENTKESVKWFRAGKMGGV